MKGIILFILMIGCTSPQSLLRSGDPEIEKVSNKIIIKGDSNVVHFNYMRIYGISKAQLDSLLNELDTIR